jgi:hypothetical protein
VKVRDPDIEEALVKKKKRSVGRLMDVKPLLR